jgi:hypothetical protein
VTIKDICKNIKGQDIKVNSCLKKSSATRASSNIWGTLKALQEKSNATESLNKKTLEQLVKKAESVKPKTLSSRPVSDINSDSENFIFRITKPVGLCGVVLVNPMVLDDETIVRVLSKVTEAGNAVIVVCVGSQLSDGVLQTCNSQCFFAESVANSVDEALNGLASTGKVDLSVVYHNNDGVNVKHSTSFNNLIVTINGEIDENLLMTIKVVHM